MKQFVRQKTLHNTLPPSKPNAQVRRYNSDKFLIPSSGLLPKTSQNCENTAGLKDHKFSKKSILRKIHLLDEMGFSSQIESKAESNLDQHSHLKRRFSIGISDFWTGPSRQKFLRENGFEEAFEKLKKNAIIKDILHSVSLRKPGLPCVMDSNLKRRNSLICEEGKGQASRARDSSVYLKNGEKISEAIDFVVDRCNDLAQDYAKFKKLGEKMQVDIRQKTGNCDKGKKKISAKDKKMIAAIATTME